VVINNENSQRFHGFNAKGQTPCTHSSFGKGADRDASNIYTQGEELTT